jgi:hypothetical protein
MLDMITGGSVGADSVECHVWGEVRLLQDLRNYAE